MQPQQSASKARIGLFIVIGLIVVALLLLLGMRLLKGGTPPTVENEKSSVSTDITKGVKFTGTISSVSCYDSPVLVTESGCTIALIGSKSNYVTIEHGMAKQDHDWGTITGLSDLEKSDHRGEKVEIYAHKLADHYYTLEGSSKFYAKSLE